MLIYILVFRFIVKVQPQDVINLVNCDLIALEIEGNFQ